MAAVDPSFGLSDISIGLGRASPEQAAELAEGVGAGVFRIPFDWRWAERVRDRYELDIYDRTYRAMLARGIRPLFTLAGAPRWAWPPLVGCPGDCFVPPAPEFDGEWREIAALLARRYPRAAGIEIWNEPNEFSFWTTGPDPGRYTQLLRQAHDAIKKEDPTMTVVGGAGNRADSEGGSVPGLAFLREVFDHGGGASVDALAVHPYVSKNRLEDLPGELEAVRALSADYDRSGIPLWVTEFGFTTTGPEDEYLRVSDDEQAANLVQAYRTLKSEPDVRKIIFQALIDWYDDPNNPSSGYGLVRGDLSLKPAYCALHQAVGVPGSCP